MAEPLPLIRQIKVLAPISLKATPRAIHQVARRRHRLLHLQLLQLLHLPELQAPARQGFLLIFHRPVSLTARVSRQSGVTGRGKRSITIIMWTDLRITTSRTVALRSTSAGFRQRWQRSRGTIALRQPEHCGKTNPYLAQTLRAYSAIRFSLPIMILGEPSAVSWKA